MPLSKSTLKDNIVKAFNDGMKIQQPNPAPPQLSSAMADLLATAYDDYAKNAIAGGLTSIATPGLKSALVAQLTGCEDYAGWAIGVALYWAPVMFTGGGFIPANPVLPPSVTLALVGISGEMPGYIRPSSFPTSIEESADKLATILHSNTTKLQVLATTTSTPPVITTETVA